jgi:hypothetical protein
MARASDARPKWAEEFWKNWQPPTDEDLARRREVIDAALKLRKKLDIRPMTTTELVRSVREDEEDD